MSFWKFKSLGGGSTTLASVDRLTDIVVDLFPNVPLTNGDAITWDGLTVTQAQCEAYGLVFGTGSTGFSAKIYPDGSIVGSNSLGSFEAKANGELICSSRVYASWAVGGSARVFGLPIVFNDADTARSNQYVRGTTGAKFIIWLNSLTVSTIEVGIDNSFSAALSLYVEYDLSGRWK